MGLFDRFKKKPAADNAQAAQLKQGNSGPVAKPGVSPELEAVLADFRRATVLPTVNLKVSRGETTVWSSKLGGTPYLPQGFAYPRSRNPHSGERPLRLLAQLNFAELPPLPDFPAEGILQFYIDPEELYGADFDHPTEQTGFRVVWHEQVERDGRKLQPLPNLQASGDDMMPFEGELVLRGELSEMPMSVGDFRFDTTFLAQYRERIPTDAQQVWNLAEAERDHIWSACEATGHRIGGYPYFTQQDPRSYSEELRAYTTLLLQLDSEGIDGGGEILWGDCGVAGFFIRPEDLQRRDFSRVLYSWDCC